MSTAQPDQVNDRKGRTGIEDNGEVTVLKGHLEALRTKAEIEHRDETSELPWEKRLQLRAT